MEKLSRKQGLALVELAFSMEPGGAEVPDDQIFRLRDVMERTGLGKSSIYELIDRGEFPKPVQLTARAVGWNAHEVRLWIRTRKRNG